MAQGDLGMKLGIRYMATLYGALQCWRVRRNRDTYLLSNNLEVYTEWPMYSYSCGLFHGDKPSFLQPLPNAKHFLGLSIDAYAVYCSCFATPALAASSNYL